MSVDLGVRIVSHGVTKEHLFRSIHSRLSAAGISDVRASWRERLDDPITQDIEPLDLTSNEELLVRVVFFDVPLGDVRPLDSSDDEGGLWASVEVVTRSNAALFLMFLAAAGIAEAANAPVVDEAELLNRGRMLTVDAIDGVLASCSGPRISSAAVAFIERIGGSPFSN